MSIRKLTADNGCLITFSANDFVIKNKQGKIIARRTKREGLYVLEDPDQVVIFTSFSNSNKVDYNVGYKRLGHLNEASIKNLCNQNMIFITRWKES